MKPDDPMLQPLTVFHAPWRDYPSGQWGFRHVDHWCYCKSEAEARRMIDYLRSLGREATAA